MLNPGDTGEEKKIWRAMTMAVTQKERKEEMFFMAQGNSVWERAGGATWC